MTVLVALLAVAVVGLTVAVLSLSRAASRMAKREADLMRQAALRAEQDRYGRP